MSSTVYKPLYEIQILSRYLQTKETFHFREVTVKRVFLCIVYLFYFIQSYYCQMYSRSLPLFKPTPPKNNNANGYNILSFVIIIKSYIHLEYWFSAGTLVFITLLIQMKICSIQAGAGICLRVSKVVQSISITTFVNYLLWRVLVIIQVSKERFYQCLYRYHCKLRFSCLSLT